MSLDMIEANPPTTLAAIYEFADKRGIVLPGGYIDFLMSTNGGVPKFRVFPIVDMPLNPFGGVQVFYGIGVRWPTTELSFVYDLNASSIPLEIVPIASNGGGDYVCLDLREGRQRVAFWDRRHFWGTGEWREQDLYLIANTVEEFFAGLKEDDA